MLDPGTLPTAAVPALQDSGVADPGMEANVRRGDITKAGLTQIFISGCQNAFAHSFG